MDTERLDRLLDEARAEVSRREREHEAVVEAAQKALAIVASERDEARAEVERLRASEMNANSEAHGMATERRAMLEHIERMQELIDSIATIVGTPGDDPGDLDGFEALRLHVRATVDALQMARNDADAARAEVDRMRHHASGMEDELRYGEEVCAKIVDERDEALSQVKAWQAEELSRRTERDEARAEVERLRDMIRRSPPRW